MPQRSRNCFIESSTTCHMPHLKQSSLLMPEVHLHPTSVQGSIIFSDSQACWDARLWGLPLPCSGPKCPCDSVNFCRCAFLPSSKTPHSVQPLFNALRKPLILCAQKLTAGWLS